MSANVDGTEQISAFGSVVFIAFLSLQGTEMLSCLIFKFIFRGGSVFSEKPKQHPEMVLGKMIFWGKILNSCYTLCISSKQKIGLRVSAAFGWVGVEDLQFFAGFCLFVVMFIYLQIHVEQEVREGVGPVEASWETDLPIVGADLRSRPLQRLGLRIRVFNVRRWMFPSQGDLQQLPHACKRQLPPFWCCCSSGHQEA